MIVNPFSYLIKNINTVIQTNDNVVNLSSKTAKQLIDDVYAGGAKVWYISATGGQKLSDLPIVQAGTYVVYAFTYYKAIHFIGTDGRSLYFNYGDNTWKQIALTSDISSFIHFQTFSGTTDADGNLTITPNILNTQSTVLGAVIGGYIVRLYVNNSGVWRVSVLTTSGAKAASTNVSGYVFYVNEKP